MLLFMLSVVLQEQAKKQRSGGESSSGSSSNNNAGMDVDTIVEETSPKKPRFARKGAATNSQRSKLFDFRKSGAAQKMYEEKIR